MRALMLVIACTGCESILGLHDTKYTGGPDAAVDSRLPDACVGPRCQAFASCHALQTAFPNAPSGVYSIDAGSGGFQTYCEQTGDGGGWTLALKVDGSA